ncbi:MAG TPA: MFS transporter [Candidatus Methylacidiphilales bacterium]|nr:MFS transporter [Candidatus Methylacidiphilales bacterium]
MKARTSSPTDANANWRRFVFFRVLFNSRFYYPVLAVFFLDLGLSATQYTLLNFAWAIAIVCADVPAGVLADRIGRKPLVVGATIGMIGEMLLLVVAPLNGGLMLFLFCLANRVLSGVAEGMASGADEALVFDSLAERNRSNEWPDVLNQVVRWQSVGMVIAMLVGGACYDPVFMTRLVHEFGFSTSFTQATTLRFPVYLNLASAVLALVVVIGFREPSLHKSYAGLVQPGEVGTTKTAWGHLLAAGGWIVRTPVALFVMIAGLLMDSVVRLFLTFSSSYFRMIHLPAASFGIIGASFAGLGLIVSPIARQMVKTFSLRANYFLLACVVLVGLVGAAFEIPIWGVVFMVPLGVAMTALAFMVSYYLNALVDSHHRATVLSFKGLAFNLGYGFIGLLFALVLKAFQRGVDSTQALAEGFKLLPLWVTLTGVVILIAFWSKRRALGAKI